MEIINEGVEYKLRNYEDKERFQLLKFITKDAKGKIEDGTTTEEVLHVLISRVLALNRNRPNLNNRKVINNLRDALQALKDRKNEKIRTTKIR